MYTTILPWVKCANLGFPMGVSRAPNIFQSVMIDILLDLDYVLVCKDNILVIQQVEQTRGDQPHKKSKL